MLKKVVNVFKSMFGDEIKEEYEERTIDNKKTYHKRSNVEAKVTYEYPKTPFRFPIDIEEKKIRDERRMRERNRQQVKHRETIQPLHKEIKREVKQPVETGNIQRQRFTPTKVPSPIYGYQERSRQRMIEDEPAYKRTEAARTTQQAEKEVEVKESPKKTVHVESKVLHEEPAFLRKEQEQVEKAFKQDSSEEKRTQEEMVDTSSFPTVSAQEQRIKRMYEQRVSIQKEAYSENGEQLKEQAEILPLNRDVAEEKLATNQASYHLPFHLLNDQEKKSLEDKQWVYEQQQLLESTLSHFNVQAKVVHASQGPSVTRFEVQPEIGVKVSKVRNLTDDIKMNMSAKDIRMEAPIPGKNTIGIEIPNISPQMVSLQEVLEVDQFTKHSSPLAVGLGVNVEGRPLITDIGKMPHGLIAGATGSGKSVCINTTLLSLIYKSSYEDVKLMLIDPKMVELSPYNGIPHLVSPVITDVKAATAALKWAVQEMEDRYERFVEEGVRDISRYNDKANRDGKEKMPYLVIVIDELADLMMVAPQDVEDAICRIAQKARACGIHLLIATQRPSVDVITGLIKANIPSRIAFSVSSQVDSRTIIDTNGAERLLGRGDMLFLENGTGKTVRLQGAFVSDEEIERITNYARHLAEPNYLFEQEQLLQQVVEEEEVDELFVEAVEFLFEQNGISTSLLQRQFRIGYNRAARLIDTLEMRGIISGPNGSKPREVLLTKDQYEQLSAK